MADNSVEFRAEGRVVRIESDITDWRAAMQSTDDRMSHWAERVATSQRVTSDAYLNGDPPPTRNQIAAVIRSLADFTHNQHMVSDDVIAMGGGREEFGAQWAHATGLGRYFHALANQLETGRRDDRLTDKFHVD